MEALMPNNDLLVDLYAQDFKKELLDIKVKRVLSTDSDSVVDFIQKRFSPRWASEVKSSLYQANPSCFIAVDEKQIVGFACYNATAKGFFGPMGVDENYRKKGIGTSLVIHCLEAMYFDGYAYAIIGGVSERTQPFYHHICGSTPIENSRKIYSRMYDR
jgi:GNAT superfamily N-acetyltransferase